MRAAIYNQYLDTLGGGERYTLGFVKVLIELGFEVDIEWKDKDIIKKLESRFNFELNNINVVSDIKRGDGYDLCFWVSDGSVPLLRARKNFLHFQVPFHDINGNTLLNKMKLFRINKVICNSEFTKSFIDKEFGIKSIVVYPPVDITGIKSKRKENIILSVGRFSTLLQSKGQEVLLRVFKKMVDAGTKNWKLIFVGGDEVGDGGFSQSLIEASKGYPVEVIKSPGFKFIKELYAKSKIFWSATGFGQDEILNPQKVEHFGITVIEAMAGGAVPLAFKAGGFKETIKNNFNGFLWENEEELIEMTNNLITNKNILKSISLNAVNSSKKYSYEEFKSNITQIL